MAPEQELPREGEMPDSESWNPICSRRSPW